MLNPIKYLLALWALATYQVQAMDLRVDNVHLYQAHTQSFSAPSTLYINAGKIVAVESVNQAKKPANKVVNAEGQYALPGLTDLHVHLSSSGSNYNPFQFLPVNSHFNANLYLGVTNVVDLFIPQLTLKKAQNLSEQRITPTLFHSGTVFTNPGGHGTQFGVPAYEISTNEDIARFWPQHLATHPHVTKAIVESHGSKTPSLTREQLTELGKRSKAAGLPFFVHVSNLQDAKMAVKAGATALAHGIYTEEVDGEFIQLMLANHVTYIPTLSVIYSQQQEHESQQISSNPQFVSVLPEKMQYCMFEKVGPARGWKQQAWQQRQTSFNNIVKLHQAGVNIGAGSDAGNPYTFHGIGLHTELFNLSRAGLSNADAIDTATINAAKAINQSGSIGQLQPGYDASFVLMPGNPVKDLNALSSISAVYKSGQAVDRHKLSAENQNTSPFGPECHLSEKAKTANKLIDNFMQTNRWETLNDHIINGHSQSKLTYGDGLLSINGQLGKPTQFGAWTGAQLHFQDRTNASSYQGVEITYQSSGSEVSFALHQADVKDWNHFSTNLPASSEWQTVRVTFSQLQQLGYGQTRQWDPSNLLGLSFVWRALPGQEYTDKNWIKLKQLSYF